MLMMTMIIIHGSLMRTQFINLRLMGTYSVLDVGLGTRDPALRPPCATGTLTAVGFQTHE